jgi:hypothetical protein
VKERLNYPAATVAFLLTYAVLYANRLPTLIYLPQRGTFCLFVAPRGTDATIAMLWYGWVISGVLGGLLGAVIFPAHLAQRVWRIAWFAAPLLMGYAVYHESHYFGWR